MKYKSTRGGGSHEYYTFEEALLRGYAPDGGLFVPTSLPTITAECLRSWSTLTYPELAYNVLRMFISSSEINDQQLKDICNKSYAMEDFDNASFIIPVNKLGSAFIAELFHGPTFCFKDFGMRPAINLLSHFATLRNRATTILVSTTGDTGPAAVHAVSEAANPLLTIIVHYPHGQISEFQRKQLTTVNSKYVKVAAFEGGGDDMDWPIKETLLMNGGNDGSTGGRTFCGINSYNIGRPLLQMVHFIWIYFRTVEQLGGEPGDKSKLSTVVGLDNATTLLTSFLRTNEDCKIDMVLPTGAMGNLTGGYMAKLMGVPIGKLCAGVNINDITHRVLDKGEFHKKRIQKTLSDAINIELPYNFERIAYFVTGCNCSLVKEWMTVMEQTHQLTLEPDWQARFRLDFDSASVTDDEMCHALRTGSATLNYVADPHTAVAMAAAEKIGYKFTTDSSGGQMIPMVIIATASPCKFQEAVTVALGQDGWNSWHANNFPARAQKTIQMQEVEPYRYSWTDGASLKDVQSLWRQMMLDIVTNNF